MGWFLTGGLVVSNFETRMVFDGNITYWTNNRDKSVKVFRNPITGAEERHVLEAPQPWWVIQHEMQIIEDVFGGSPMLEIQHSLRDGEGYCLTCGGSGGGYDREQNWVDCPDCETGR